MMGKKRGLHYFIALILLSSPIFAGYCTDPNIVDTYCDPESTEAQCPGYYHETMPNECEIGCCFAASGTVCQEGTYKGFCSGEFAATCAEIADSKCSLGCCCWFENTKQSQVQFKGTCSLISGSQFFDEIESASSCSAKCETVIVDPPPPGDEPQCSDGIDNDQDTLIDASDRGCLDSLDVYHPEDDSEAENLPECQDGQDNDLDTFTDMDDSCCDDFADKSENFCDMPGCVANQRINLEFCRCHDSYTCETGEYCCATGCFRAQCSSGTCIDGSKRSCGEFIGSCELFQYCSGGTWTTECTPEPGCGVPIERCADGIDNNADKVIDCQDVICHGVQCTQGAASCGTKGYQDPASGDWYCCYAGTVSDCLNNDKVPDTCGVCDCNQAKPSPSITKLSVQRGVRGIKIDWALACDKEMFLYKCMGKCTDYNAFTLVNVAGKKFSFLDEDVIGDKDYCYFVQADYGTDVRNSAIVCKNAGAEACMISTTDDFCLDAQGGFTGLRVQRAHCTQENKLEKVGSVCPADYVCMGPYADGTKCVYQSPCDECGGTINMFADFQSSRTSFYDQSSGSTYDMLCREIPTCYFDYTDTSVDKFHRCSNVDYCYRYRSESACEGQSTLVNNNKCLPRNCEWVPIQGSLDRGICFESVMQFKTCDYCNFAENNDIFDKCTLDRCRLFGNCYPRRLDGRCTDASDLSCQDYSTQTDCTGSRAVAVNVAYSQGVRVSGNYDNTVTPSLDVSGLGVCMWDAGVLPSCFKDADGDKRPDPGQNDLTPPFTKVLTNLKVKSLNLTLEVSDPEPDGSMGLGVKYTYVCMDDARACYPTEKYVPESGKVNVDFGGGQGEHDIYFYSEDKANNLEVLKHATFGVDRTAPVIRIQAYPTLDIVNYKNSSVTFMVSTNEASTCKDNFEGIKAPQISNKYGTSWIPSYSPLKDGKYAYNVTCTDDVGNVATAIFTVTIDADQAIFDASPQGYTDQQQVVLTIKTQNDIRCRFGPDEAAYASLPNSFGTPTRVNSGSVTYFLHSYPYTLTNSGTYSFDVKCDLGDRFPDDEIQFIYDGLAPATKVLDASGKLFNFSKIYQGVKDRIFLSCTDLPAGGFGCNSTAYCVGTAKCTPSKKSNPVQPINYTLDKVSSSWLCYRSIENRKGTMGGRTEATICQEIRIDSYIPKLFLEEVNGSIDTKAPFATWKTSYRLRGFADDPDVNGAEANKVRIIVSATGLSRQYNITATPEFEQILELKKGMNTITIVAEDRSGAKATKTIYINVGDYTGQKITLVKPKFGVSLTRAFDLVVQTYIDAQCRWSYNNAAFDSSIPMTKSSEPSGDDIIYYHTYKNYELNDLSEVEEPLYIRCKDGAGMPFDQSFKLMWDESEPEIIDLVLDNSDGKVPPTVVEFPLRTNIVVTTDDKARCRYSTAQQNFDTMTRFKDYENQTLKTVNKQLFDNLVDGQSYTYYIQCENGAGLVTERKVISFSVNTKAATGFTFLEPTAETSLKAVIIKLKTEKTTTDCLYGTSSPPTQAMQAIDQKTHVTPSIAVTEGTYKYYFECRTAAGKVQDSYTFLVDLTPPTKPEVDDGMTTKFQNQLSAKWSSSDNMTKIMKYEYAIGSTPGGTDISTWKQTTERQATVTGLKLKNESVYYWSVRAVNSVSLWSQTTVSDGVKVTSSTGNWNGTNSTGACKADADCDDSKFCTIDSCDFGTCKHQTIDCVDARDCTSDRCDESIDKCVHDTQDCKCSSDNDCQDGNPCTDDKCTLGSCGSSLNTKPCNDNNFCTYDDVCKDGRCVPGPALDCNDGRSCSIDSCDSKVGCVYKMDTCFCREDLDCADGNPCTLDDCDESQRVCKATKFSASGVTCDNWQWCDEADVCDGRGHCVGKSKDCSSTMTCALGVCIESLDICEKNFDGCTCTTAADCNDNNPCTDDSCGTDGTCAYIFTAKTCDDGDNCTISDKCMEGMCVGTDNPKCAPRPDCSKDSDCNDNKFCTIDKCVNSKCTSGEARDCKDSRDCTFDRCDESQDLCIHETDTCSCSTTSDCQDGNPCTDDICKDGSCDSFSNTGSCNDNNLCTGSDKCEAGKCVSGSQISCDDKRTCSVDSCDAGLGCVYNMGNCVCSADADCNDADPCTVDACSGGKCNAPLLKAKGTVCNNWLFCDENDYCDTQGQCIGAPMSCKPNMACATSACVESLDICQDNLGKCQCTTATDCDDGNPCTEDSCTSGTCTYKFISAACDDGEDCTTGDKCQEGSCIGIYNTGCDTPSQCDSNSDCQDGRFCTIGSCVQGRCDYSSKRNCADSRDCTIDSCDEIQDICIHKTDGCSCSSDVQCQDGNPCTDDKCESGTCSQDNNEKACNDNNLCTLEDTCVNGGCLSGGQRDCDDKKSCSTEKCEAKLGCVYDLESCPCTTNVDCADSDPCSVDACDKAEGVCEPIELEPEGTSCENWLWCDEPDVCNELGKCVGAPKACAASESCAVTSCVESLDVCQENMAACTCSGNTDCDDRNPCTDDKCESGKCLSTYNTAACDDGEECTIDDACTEGLCIGERSLSCKKVEPGYEDPGNEKPDDPDDDCPPVNGQKDSDCDGMPDSWETEHNLLVGTDDSEGNPDDDIYTNYEEYLQGTDPHEKDGNGLGWAWIIFIILMVLIISAGGYVGYMEYEKKKRPERSLEPRQRLSISGPLQKGRSLTNKYLDSLSSMMRRKRQNQKVLARDDLMKKFDDDTNLKKLPEKPAKESGKAIVDVKKPEEPKASLLDKQAQRKETSKAEPVKKAEKAPQRKAQLSVGRKIDGLKGLSDLAKNSSLKGLSEVAKGEKSQDSLKGLSEVAKGEKPQDSLKSSSELAKKGGKTKDSLKGLSEVAKNVQGEKALKELKKIAKK